ncbi:MAG TPA: YciI family protein [Sphingomicrobium sp.]|nr:YciI family protein [Sphingomicrobium sp.]
MRFVWIGFLKEGAPAIPQAVQQQVSDFIGQPFINVCNVGALRNAAGDRAAMMMIFEADSRAAAEALVESSPYLRAGLYREHHLFEFQDEVG